MSNIMKKHKKDLSELASYYAFLISKKNNNESIDIANEYLIENYYLLAEARDKIKKQHRKFSKNHKLVKQKYYFLKSLVSNNNYNLSFKCLTEKLIQYQNNTHQSFNYNELFLIFYTLPLIYIEKLNDLCRDEYKKIVDKEDASRIIKSKNDLVIEEILPPRFDIQKNTYFIFELNNQINKLEDAGNNLFKELNEYLKKNSISLKELINSENQRKIESDILISNIFNGLRLFLNSSLEEIYTKVSKTEKLLRKDPIYKSMDKSSKTIYRNQITKLAKKNHLDEYSYLEKNLTPKEHIGFKIFKHSANEKMLLIYIILLLLISIVMTIFLAKCFISQKIIGSIILFIPVLQLVKEIINKLLALLIKKPIIPKIDYTKGLPPEEKTMIVLPSAITEEKKVEELFTKLETIYLANKTENLYFALLEYNEQIKENDGEIAHKGIKIAETLNKKYKKDIFYFAYQKSTSNQLDNNLSKYEIKMQALYQFNKIFLGEEKNDGVNIFPSTRLGIKYIITIDDTTELSFDAIPKLVGAMAHPMNQPKLNKKGTKVIKGYAMLQPKIETDIEAVNKNLYSQLFAKEQNTNTLETASFGTVIYNLQAFQKIVTSLIGNNDLPTPNLLKRNYFHCNYVFDTKVVNCSKTDFLIDAANRQNLAIANIKTMAQIRKIEKNKENKISLFEKYKIADSIIRLLLAPSLLIIILLSLIRVNNQLFWIMFIIIQFTTPIILSLCPKTKYRSATFSLKKLLIYTYISLATIPYYISLYICAILKATHKLNSLSSSQANNNITKSLKDYIQGFTFNLVVGITLIGIGYLTNNYLALIMSFVFTTIPLLLYKMDQDTKLPKKRLNENKRAEIRELSERIWLFFSDNLKEEYNYLIPYSYQENRKQTIEKRTTPTSIGYSLISIISSYELEIIDKDTAIFLIEKILKTIDTLDKWNGHLYNWYNIETKEVLFPRFISTIESGNLTAALIVTQSFLKKCDLKGLVNTCEKLIKGANFKALYKNDNTFSIGYDSEEEKLLPSESNMLISRLRLTSYISICLGSIPISYWMDQDRTFVTYKGRKGLASSSGTALEYYMPFLFMKHYYNTLLEKAYYFSYFCQRKYVSKISHKLPWGISESGYNEIDSFQNYKSKTFFVPFLKISETIESKVVISPYSSLMALELFPSSVYTNIKKFKKLSMYSKYGLYEAYDYDNKGIVQSYFAPHQGMSLVGIVNFFKNDIIKEYFHENSNIKAFALLLKEQMPLRPKVKVRQKNYQPHNYIKQKNKVNNNQAYENRSLPKMTVLSNKNYSLIIDFQGNSLSKYRTLQLNRYRKMTMTNYGIFLFAKDLNTKQIFSNTYAPMNIETGKYEANLSPDKIKYTKQEHKIEITTEIIVCSNYNAEIRKITFKNRDKIEKSLELTSYTEPIICGNTDDIDNRIFNNMFIHTKFDSKTNSLIAKRKNSDRNSYMFMKLLLKEPLESYTYETERENFIGRNNNLNTAKALNMDLTNYCGDNIDPILSIRNKLLLPPEKPISVFIIVGFGRNIKQIQEFLEIYNTPKLLEEEFKKASLMNIETIRNMNITQENAHVFHKILSHLYQEKYISITEEKVKSLKQNPIGTNGLWKFGISGKRPIITIEISDIEHKYFVNEILKLFEYYKTKSIFIDIIIINNVPSLQRKILEKEIQDEMYRMHTINSFYNTPGEVVVIDKENITIDDRKLLKVISKLFFIIERKVTLKEYLEQIESSLQVEKYPPKETLNTIETTEKDLTFTNGFGGFSKNGTEYVIYNKNTPMPWINIIANENFGTIISNNGAGYTYAYNSKEFKISSWTGESLTTEKSEGFKFNNKVFDPDKCTHGFGYSKLEGETNELSSAIIEFVSSVDNIKIYLVKIKNKKEIQEDLQVEFFIKPVLGSTEELTSNNILTEYIEKNNYLKMRNTYIDSYSDINVFISSSEKIAITNQNKVLEKSITFKVSLEPLSEKTISIILGCASSDKEVCDLLNKYKSIKNCQEELECTKEYWRKRLGKIQIYTPDESFNFMINGWYLYQTISSGILSKSGIFKNDGRFNYKDQLQNAMNIVLIDQAYTKKQLLISAAHQFIEGDTLHWWDEQKHVGLRGRYKDDYLWLIYATINYIEVTSDYKILEEKIPYSVGEKISDYEIEKEIIFHYSDKKDSLLNHCLKALELAMASLGKHKIPLIGCGDWNAGMNGVGVKGKGESILLGFFLYSIIDSFKIIMQKYDKSFDCTRFTAFSEKLRESLNAKSWDGKYYLRAFYDNGDKLGSHENNEYKIDLLSQSLSIISEIVPENRVKKIIASVEKDLVDEKKKIIKLFAPPLANSLNNPGYIMDLPEGMCENGGQYTPAVAWYIMALIKIGNYDKAYTYYQMINPLNRTKNEESTKQYKVEPYVIAETISSSDNFVKRGGYTWNTTAAGWFYRIGTQDILGLKRNGDKLKIEPALPKTWKGYKMVYHYLDTTYNIKVTKGDEYREIDGQKNISKTFRLVNDAKEHEIIVSISEKE